MGGYSEFDKNVRYKNGRRTFIGDNFTALLSVDGSHLDKQAHPHDLLNTHLAPGIRKLPSDINVLILNAIQNTKTDTYHTLIPQTHNHDQIVVPPLQRGARGDSSLNFNLTPSPSPSEGEGGISLTAPLALKDLISINQRENIVINVLANDSDRAAPASADRDGTLIPNSLQITSQPNNGVITVN